jgi:hypothetical protein
LNELEALGRRTRAAIVIAHHFAKGDSTAKNPVDRMSGAGVWARDADSLVVMTQHEEDDCFTVNMTVRNLPRVDDFVVRWDYPLMQVAKELNPEALRRPQSKSKVCTDKEFKDQVFGNSALSFGKIMQVAKDKLGMSRATAARYLQRGVDTGVIVSVEGLYWPHQAQTE